VRAFPPVSGEWQEWARSLTRALQFGWQTLDHKNADSRATQDGILLWDASAGEVVVSDAGAFVPVAGNVATDLAYTAATRILTSSTGADVTLPLVASADAGLAPASGGGTSNYLRADGTWTAPPGASHALTDLTDVTVSGAAQGQVLVRGSSEFQNLTTMTVSLGPFYINDLGGTGTTQATLGYFNTATALSRDTNNILISRAGRVVGLIMVSDAARTAGTATARVRIDGVGTTFDSGSVVLTGT
jgi:hypothetical protein